MVQIQPVTCPVALKKNCCSLHYAWCLHMYPGSEGARNFSSHTWPTLQTWGMSAGSSFFHVKGLLLASGNWEIYGMILVLLQIE